MNKLSKLIYLFIFVAGLLSVSCVELNEPDDEQEPVTTEKDTLSAPLLTVTDQTLDSFGITWQAVEGAAFYSYDFSGAIERVDGTSLHFSGLTSGETYTVKVKALPEDTEHYVESEWAEVSVTLSEEAIGDMFSIEYTDIKDRLAVVYTITPVDPAMWYYRDAFTDATWEEFGANPEDVWQNALQGYIDFFGIYTFQMVAEKGIVQSQFDYTYDQHTYILVAGIDTAMNRITSVVDTVYYSGPVQPSDMTFDVDVREITTSSANVYVMPSSNEPYSMLLMESSDLEDYTMEEIEEYVIKEGYGEYISDGHVYNGPLTMQYKEGQLDAGVEYTVLVFGWNTTLNTDVTVKTFETLPASSSAELTFEWNIEILGPSEIHAVITPSDMDAQYIVIPMPDYDYEYYADENGVVDIDAYVEYVTFGMITPYEYVDMFVTTGVTDKVFDDWNDGIYPGSSYMFMAVGCDIDHAAGTVQFYTPQTYGEMITTPEEEE